MENARAFPTRVTRFEDGAYRWAYDMRARGNHAPYWHRVLRCAAVSVPIAVLMLAMAWKQGPARAAMWCGLFLAATVLAPAVMWRLTPQNPCFRLASGEIEAWPKGRRRNNAIPLAGVKRVKLLQDKDCIALSVGLGGLRIYVPPEDYALVRDLILDRVPESAR